MIPTPQFVAVLDACVLYPAPIRDILLHLADVELFTPKWTGRIHEEWTRNLLLNRPDLTAGQLQKTMEAMQKAFPDANISGYEVLIPSISLPDEDDCHVLAAAIRCGADVIVTFNLKDFPGEYLRQFDLDAQHPDQFIAELLDLNPEKGLFAFQQQVSFLKNPPLTHRQVLDSLRKVGLQITADKLAKWL
ncbi:hypothetical protein GCM10023189_03580 [Nibrella saemangeumensis]|uniref:PIN domain-containing protein n=1 Tax=Nibrella saemangeumensis TaxID=1084526 RepID=A0ABP8MEF1_9BACT